MQKCPHDCSRSDIDPIIVNLDYEPPQARDLMKANGLEGKTIYECTYCHVKWIQESSHDINDGLISKHKSVIIVAKDSNWYSTPEVAMNI